MIVRMCILSYYHHQIRNVNHQPLFRVRSWNNWMRCMFYYVLTRVLGLDMLLSRATCRELWGPSWHGAVIKWKHLPRYWPLWGESTGNRWIPLTKPVTRSFDIFCDLRLNKRLSKQSGLRCFETPSRSLWRHCNGKFVNSMSVKSNSCEEH